jgi:hypothetical protein
MEPITAMSEALRNERVLLTNPEDIKNKLMRSGVLFVSTEENGKVNPVEYLRESAWQLAMFQSAKQLKALGIVGDPRKVDLNLLDESERHGVQQLVALLRQVVIRHLEFTSAVSGGGLIEEVLDAYQNKDWDALDMEGEEEWLESSIVNQSRWRTIVRQYVPALLGPLSEIEVYDENGNRVTPKTFTRAGRKQSFIEDLGPVLKHLSVTGEDAKPEDVELYKELVGSAASRPKSEVRALLVSKGLRDDPKSYTTEDRSNAHRILVERPHPDTGELRLVCVYVLEADSTMTEKWIEGQLARRYEFAMPVTANNIEELGVLVNKTKIVGA